MKNDADERDSLLDVVLRDEAWLSDSASLKSKALEAFRARQRVRSLTKLISRTVAVLLIVAVSAVWIRHPVKRQQRAETSSKVESSPRKPDYLTDEELLSKFPPGSCFLAEVDGKKELIFLDPQMERKYVSGALRR